MRTGKYRIRNTIIRGNLKMGSTVEEKEKIIVKMRWNEKKYMKLAEWKEGGEDREKSRNNIKEK